MIASYNSWLLLRRCLFSLSLRLSRSLLRENRLRRRARPGLGLLRRVRMLRATIDLQAAQHIGAEMVVGQHPLHRALDNPLGMLRERLAQRLFLQAAGIAGVAIVDLLVLAATRHGDLRGVDD